MSKEKRGWSGGTRRAYLSEEPDGRGGVGEEVEADDGAVGQLRLVPPQAVAHRNRHLPHTPRVSTRERHVRACHVASKRRMRARTHARGMREQAHRIHTHTASTHTPHPHTHSIHTHTASTHRQHSRSLTHQQRQQPLSHTSVTLPYERGMFSGWGSFQGG
eukprot:2672041-Rhodomonas_salina.1